MVRRAITGEEVCFGDVLGSRRGLRSEDRSRLFDVVFVVWGGWASRSLGVEGSSLRSEFEGDFDFGCKLGSFLRSKSSFVIFIAPDGIFQCPDLHWSEHHLDGLL